MKSGGFMIHGLIRFELLGQELWITTTHVSLLTVMLILCVFALAVRKTMKTAKALPAGFQNAAEMMVEMLDRMTENGMGPYAPKFADYISSIFLFVLVSNLSGLLGVRPPTADYGVALALGLMTFAVVQYCNIRYNKARALTELFRPIPLLFPINLIGELSAPFSLSLRLFWQRTLRNGYDVFDLHAAFSVCGGVAGIYALVFRCLFRKHTDLCVLYADNGSDQTEAAAVIQEQKKKKHIAS